MANPTGGEFRSRLTLPLNLARDTVIVALGAVESQESSFSSQHFDDITEALNDARDSIYAAIVANAGDTT